jgi:NAD+ diphosphatase
MLGYVQGGLNRRSEAREDDNHLKAARNHPFARTYMLSDNLVFFKEPHDPLFKLTSDDNPVYMGEMNGAPRFALYVEENQVEELKAAFASLDLRTITLQGLFAGEHLSTLASAKALFHWHKSHKFCGSCSGKTIMKKAGWQRDCMECASPNFPRTDPVVIMLVTHEDKCLLGRQARFVPKSYSTLAGFMEPGETIEHAVQREIFEEAGIETKNVQLALNQPWPFPASLMLGCIAEAVTTDLTIDYNELEEARWFTRDEVKLMFTKTHPDGLIVPPPLAIAHHLMKIFVN